jgi:chromosome segregation ATPase
LRNQLAEAVAARDAFAQQLSEKITELEQRKTAEHDLRQQAAEREDRLSEVTRERASLAEERGLLIEELSSDRARAIEKLSLLQRKLEAEMSQVREESATLRISLADAVGSRDEFKRQLAEHRSQIDCLHAAESEWRELVAEQEQQISDLVQHATRHETRIQQLIEERDANLAIQGQMTRALEESRAEVERLQAVAADLSKEIEVRDASIAALTDARDEASARALQLRDQLDGMTKHSLEETAALRTQLTDALSASEETNRQLAVRSSGTESLRAEAESLKSLLEQRDSQISDLKRACDEHAKTAAGKERELQNLRKDLSIAVRLQSVREADLEDLQRSYRELLQAKKDRECLLADISQRLELASGYLHQISGQDAGDSIRETLEGGFLAHRSLDRSQG